MDWTILSTAVKDTAPVLGAILAGPFGHAVGSLIANAIGMTGKSPKDIADAITTGNFSDVLKELEAKHAGIMTYLSTLRPTKISLSVEFSQ